MRVNERKRTKNPERSGPVDWFSNEIHYTKYIVHEDGIWVSDTEPSADTRIVKFSGSDLLPNSGP